MPLLHPAFGAASSPRVTAALETLAVSGAEDRGAVFTRREVVDFILDLVGYTDERPLHRCRLLEPSVGVGDFLLPAIERLLGEFASSEAPDFESLLASVRAVEIHRESLDGMRVQLDRILTTAGFSDTQRHLLIDSWLLEGDYLLATLPTSFDFVVGNPPYVRQEMIPEALLAEYRRLYTTLYDRADLYIPFLERSLRALAPEGVLGVICSDRWMKNRYGGPLRSLVADGFHLRAYVDMVDTPAFHTDVIAYPAIAVIARARGDVTRIARRPELNRARLTALARNLLASDATPLPEVSTLAGVASGASPWVLDSSDSVSLLRRLEGAFPTLLEAGCKVGIGVATGADHVYIAPFDQLDVEVDRKVPLVMTRDIADGVVKWRGLGVLNPFLDDGSLAPFSEYPRFAAYLEKHGADIRARYVSKSNPAAWYRTIDRITPSLTTKAKLLIPDIKGEPHVVFEGGKLYPHHNLYYVVSEDWDLLALRAVLCSRIARLFITSYSTRMRGGYLRFQAQYLRRIRLPLWSRVTDIQRDTLIAAGTSGDERACDEAAYSLYDLTSAERLAISCFPA
ncbi:MAG TPA: Eco57I restriction-modification methylase domain-containing protein [Gemmatimonadaceae bacterium]